MHKLIWLSSLFLSLALPAFGCGDDDSESTPPKDGGAGSSGHSDSGGDGSGGSADKDGGSGSGGPKDGGGGSGGTSGGDGGTSGVGGGSTADGGGGSSGNNADGGSADCIDKPKSDKDFLNNCTASQCEPFDNDRIEHGDWKPGDELPEVP